MELLPFLLFAVVAGAAAWVSWYLKQKRRRELAAAALQLGLQFSLGDPFGLLGLPLALFRKGDGRGLENVMWGTWQGIDVKELDYWYYEESSDSQGRRSKTYHRFSCAISETELACPHLSIDRENLLTRIADAVGLRDVEFELEEFNRAFNVKAKDRKFAFDLLDARMMRWLLGAGDDWAFEIVGRWVLCFCKRRGPFDLVPLLGTAKGFREQIPQVAYELYGLPEPG